MILVEAPQSGVLQTLGPSLTRAGSGRPAAEFRNRPLLGSNPDSAQQILPFLIVKQG